jgi:hypothetical protein
MKNNTERENRQKDSYLESRYGIENFDNFFIAEIQEDEFLKLRPFSGIPRFDFREKSTKHSEFKNKFNSLAFNKKLNEDTIEYLPGTLNRNFDFFQHPIQVGNVLIHSITEHKKHLSEGKNIIRLSILKKEERKLNTFKFLQDNEFEDSIIHKYIYTTNNIHSRTKIYDYDVIINAINEYINLGLNPERIADNFSLPNYVNDHKSIWSYHKRIFRYVEDLTFKHYGYEIKRVGKDSQIGYGKVIGNLQGNKYLIDIIVKNTKFIFIDNSQFKNGEDKLKECDEGRVNCESGSYTETDLSDNSLKQYILFILLKNYDPEMNYILSLQI